MRFAIWARDILEKSLLTVDISVHLQDLERTRYTKGHNIQIDVMKEVTNTLDLMRFVLQTGSFVKESQANLIVNLVL
jgi:hypothetical protein